MKVLSQNLTLWSCEFSITSRIFINRGWAERTFPHHYQLKRFLALFHNMHTQLPDKNVIDWEIRQKKRHVLILPGQGEIPKRSRWGYGVPAPPHSTENEVNDLASRRWRGWVVTGISPHNIEPWTQMRTSSVCYQQVSLEPHPSRPLPPWHVGNRVQPSCTEIKRMVFKSWLGNDLGPNSWLQTENG